MTSEPYLSKRKAGERVFTSTDVVPPVSPALKSKLYFGHSFQNPENLELQELHCNRCNAKLGIFIRDVMDNIEVWEMKVVCWGCRIAEKEKEEHDAKN